MGRYRAAATDLNCDASWVHKNPLFLRKMYHIVVKNTTPELDDYFSLSLRGLERGDTKHVPKAPQGGTAGGQGGNPAPPTALGRGFR